MQIQSCVVAWQPSLEPRADDLAQSPAPGNSRILIVNEDMRSADSLKYTLQELGYTATFTAYSARRALAAVAEFSPAMVILDLELPDMTGYQLARRFRSHLQRYVRQLLLLAIAVVHVVAPLVDPVKCGVRPLRTHPQCVAGGGLEFPGG